MSFASFSSSSEYFLLFDEKKDQIIKQIGTQEDFNKPSSPCSTFKIVLSLIGFDAGVLKNETCPRWQRIEPIDAEEISPSTSTPKEWIEYSCVWFSQMLTPLLGIETLKSYLALFDYGNQDLSGDPGKDNGLTNAWLESSLQISMNEQLDFLKKMLREELPVSNHALNMTRKILYRKEIGEGWKMYGKTGLGLNPRAEQSDEEIIHNAWFNGWIERDDQRYIFIYKIENHPGHPSQRASRVEAILFELLSMNLSR